MMVEEGELADNTEFEIAGYLQKKTTKGFYVNRYFSTFGHTIRYWQDKASFDNSEKSSEIYDICDIKTVEKTGNRSFTLLFSNERFKLELKTGNDEQCREWTEALLAKRSMYSIDELLVELDMTKVNFKTETFKHLLKLKEKDQNKFILDRLDDAFVGPAKELQTNITGADSSALIRAARTTVEDLITSCEECMLEMSQRNPKITVHCRTYIRRYAEIVKGRITLELLFLPGTQEKKFEMMGEKSLSAGIELMTRVDQLSHYSFLPTDLVPTLNNTLFSTGQLISALLNLSITRLEGFIETVNGLQPSLRASKYLEIDKLLAESMLAVSINLPDISLLKLVIIKLVTTQMLCFTDHMTLLDFANYEESALIFHVNTTNILLDRFKTSYISLQLRKLIHKVKNDMDIENPNEYLLFPLAVTDALNSACYISSRNAVLKAVYNMAETVSDLTVGFLHERVVGWIGGDLCKTFIARFDSWVVHISTILPQKYSTVLFIEVGRLMVTLYFNNMTNSYINNKTIKLSSRGVQQLASDLQEIHVWMASHISAEHAMDEKNLLLTMSIFLVCTQEAALQCYADAIGKFGIQYSLHLYDIIRLVMKFRIDITSRQRKDILGLCGEYLSQLQKAASADPDLLSGSNSLEGAHYFDRSIFEVLCPLAGTEHCTGFKWGVEPFTDPGSRTVIQNLVTSTCNTARLARLQGMAASIREKEVAAGHRAAATTSPTTVPAITTQQGGGKGGGGGVSNFSTEGSSSAAASVDSPEPLADEVLSPHSSDITRSAVPLNTSMLREVPATMHTVTVKKKPKPPPVVAPLKPIKQVPLPPPSTVTAVESESETPRTPFELPVIQPINIPPPSGLTTGSASAVAGAGRSPANRPLPPTPPGAPYSSKNNNAGLNNTNSDKDTILSSAISCSSKSVFSVDTTHTLESSSSAQVHRDPNNPPLSPVIDPSSMERERVINLSFRFSLERDHSTGAPLVGPGGQLVDKNRQRRLPPTPGGTVPTPPMAITFNELESDKRAVSVRASINEQSMAKLGLKSRPLPPPPPPIATGSAACAGAAVVKPPPPPVKSPALSIATEGVNSSVSGNNDSGGDNDDAPVLVELLPIDQPREPSAPPTPAVSAASDKKPGAGAPPPKPMKRPSVTTPAAPVATTPDNVSVAPSASTGALTPEQALQLLLQKAQEDVLKAESSKKN